MSVVPWGSSGADSARVPVACPLSRPPTRCCVCVCDLSDRTSFRGSYSRMRWEGNVECIRVIRTNNFCCGTLIQRNRKANVLAGLSHFTGGAFELPPETSPAKKPPVCCETCGVDMASWCQHRLAYVYDRAKCLYSSLFP